MHVNVWQTLYTNSSTWRDNNNCTPYIIKYKNSKKKTKTKTTSKQQRLPKNIITKKNK